MNIINIVFDIDGVVAYSSHAQTQEEPFKWNNGLIVKAAGITHYIYPGTTEMLAALYSEPGVRVSFYSAGIKKRNEPLIQTIVTKAKELLEAKLNPSDYARIDFTIHLLSRSDLVSCNDLQREIQLQRFGVYPASYQKDLTKVLKPGEQLANTLLVDDHREVAAYEQQANLLFAPTPCDAHALRKLATRVDQYDSRGYKPLPCYFAHRPNQRDLEECRKGKCILVMPYEESYRILYRDADNGNIYGVPISEDLFPQLKPSLDTCIKENYTSPPSLIDDPRLSEIIRCCVTFSDGQTEKICYQANRIYYIAGVLFDMIKNSQSTQKPIAQLLLQFQYTEEKEEWPLPPNENLLNLLPRKRSFYVENLSCRLRNEEFYQRGIRKLKVINPNIALVRPQDFIKCLAMPYSPEEEVLSYTPEEKVLL